jgi:hypothetical protein
MRLSTIAISMFILSTAFAAPSSLASPYETQSLTQFIDDLVNIDAETAGLHGTVFSTASSPKTHPPNLKAVFWAPLLQSDFRRWWS